MAKTPTERLLESQGQVTEAKVEAAVNRTKFWFVSGISVAAVFFALIVYFIAPPHTTVTHVGVTAEQVEQIVAKAASDTVAKLPKAQPGLTESQIKNLLAEALKGAEGKLVTIGAQFAGLDEHIRKIGAVDGKLDVLTTEQQVLKTEQQVLKTMLEGVSAKLPLQKSGEQKQESAPVAEQPPVPLDPNAPAQNTTAPQQSAPEGKKHSAEDVTMACKGTKVQFPASFDKMTQEELAAAFTQCETARLNPTKAANTTPPSPEEIKTLQGLANRFGHSRRNQ